MIMGSYFQVEVEGRYDGEACTEQIGLVEGADFGDVSSCQHADADAYIPRGQISGGGCAALTVGSQVDEKRVVGGKHDAEADAQHQGYQEEEEGACVAVPTDDVNTRCQQEEADNDYVEAGSNDLCDFSPVHQLAREEARHGHTHGHEGEEESGGCLDVDLLGIHGHVVGGHAVGDGEQQQADACRKSFQQYEAVERDGVAFDGGLVGCLYCRGAQHAYEAGAQRATEDDGIGDTGVVQEQSCHGADGHGDVVGQAVVAQSFAATRGGHDVDDDGIAAYGDHAERYAVDDAEDDEQGERACYEVSGKHGGEDEIGQQIEGFAGKGVEQIAREGTDAQGCNGVAG